MTSKATSHDLPASHRGQFDSENKRHAPFLDGFRKLYPYADLEVSVQNTIHLFKFRVISRIAGIHLAFSYQSRYLTCHQSRDSYKFYIPTGGKKKAVEVAIGLIPFLVPLTNHRIFTTYQQPSETQV
jgi:hypothetical protein